jgi:ribosomal-protein-alanine N-acetyltransferase
MSLAGFRVRIADVADLAQVVEMERAIAEAPHWAEEEYAAIVHSGDIDAAVKRCLLVAEAEERLVGFAVGKVAGFDAVAAAELESVAVEAGVRRSGVGTALCGATVDWCRRQGATAVELEVRTGSRGAIALYEGLGFVVVGSRRAYYREPVEDAVMMRRELGGHS